MGTKLGQPGGILGHAIAALRKAIRLKPDFAEAHLILGLVLRAAGREEEARREFAEAQRLDPKLKPPE